MLRYCVLSSGSAGNCVWVQGGGTEILIDCGISARMTAERLADVGLELNGVRAAVCTHGHGDHIKGADVLARRRGIEIYGTPRTLASIVGTPPPELLHEIVPGSRFAIGGLCISSVPTMHDAPGSSAFVIDDGETRLGVLTDLGIVTESVSRAFENLDGLILEMNHDEKMLEDGPYPWFLKRRIAGAGGHLSNRQSAELLERIAHPGLRHLTLAHLSEENNRPDRAMDAAMKALSRLGLCPRISVGSISSACEPVEVSGRGQLSLGLGS